MPVSFGARQELRAIQTEVCFDQHAVRRDVLHLGAGHVPASIPPALPVARSIPAEEHARLRVAACVFGATRPEKSDKRASEGSRNVKRAAVGTDDQIRPLYHGQDFFQRE